MTSTETFTVRSMDDISSAIAIALGFHPQDSLVFIALINRDGKTFFGPMARVDTVDFFNQDFDLPDTLATFFKREATEGIIIAVYGDSDRVDQLAEFAANASIPLAGMVLMDNNPTELSPEGHAIAVFHGGVISNTREERCRLVEYHDSAIRPDDLDALLDAMSEPGSRDKTMRAMLADYQTTLPTLLNACRAVRDDEREPYTIASLLAVTAILAYRKGDGALANACLERVFCVDSRHNLARLLAIAIATGLRPAELDDLVAGNSPKD